jgi:CBS domain-containing protein
MTMIRHLLEDKGYKVWSVKPEETVFEALELMAEKNIGAVLVLEALYGVDDKAPLPTYTNLRG